MKEHKHTIIILHGRGSTAQKFAEPLLQHSVSSLAPLAASSTKYSTATQESFREHLPYAKFVFPTAPLRRAVAFNRSLTHQWFDTWSVAQPELKSHLQIQGLRETTEYLHELLRAEIDAVGPENVVLMGLSQGCAASIVATMLWRGKPFAAVVGMCGYLPFCEDMCDHFQKAEIENIDDQADLFERSSEKAGEETRIGAAINWLHEELQVRRDGILDAGSPPITSTPVFMGHGVDDDKVPVEHGKLAANFLRNMGIEVTWKECEHLGHWYSEDMLRDMVHFLQGLKGWGGLIGPADT